MLYGIALIAVAVVASLLLLGYRIDTQIAAIVGLGIVGVLLIIGAIGAARANRRS